MCGIAGIWRLDGAGVALARVRAMTAAMRHRGPDDEGYVALDPAGALPPVVLGGPRTQGAARGADLPWCPRPGPDRDPEGRALVLGHLRLAIIDLSPGGHQPLAGRGGAVWITYNGEIFNYVELRSELVARGHVFRSASDTEVLAAGWLEWGEGLFARLNGMWSLALWDGRARTLVVSRDRLGVKPFYYRFDGTEFAFASEPAGLLALGAAAPAPRAIARLIAAGRVDVGEDTFFEGIHSLPAAHHARIDGAGVHCTRFWDLPVTAGGSVTVGSAVTAGSAEALHDLLTDAVRLRLRSDVPVGTCLSGGIDSSAIVALGTRLLGAPLDAYSVAYEEGAAFDERPHMRALVAATGARHHLTVPRGDDLRAELDRVARIQGEPTAGPGVYSQWHVMRVAGENAAKVLLDGQGADELFAGYFAFYFPLRLRDLIAAGEIAPAAELARAAVARGHSRLEVAARAAEPWIPAALFRRGREWLGAGDWARVMTPELARVARAAWPEPGPARRGDELTARQAADVRSLLLPSLLRYEDRNSMAFSIEARVPFLDYRVVEFAFRLPAAAKLAGGVTKRVLRDAMRGVVPDSILARTDKRGFEAPVVRWLAARHAGWLREMLVGGRAVERGFVVRRAVAGLVDELLARPRGPGHEVWRLLSLELWLRAAFDPGGFARGGEARER